MSWLQILITGISGVVAVVEHYPPQASHINNITFALNGTGRPGIFNSSQTPEADYGTYNWCNMPHVREKEYKDPPKNFDLQFVEVIQRHHKRTPYASNTFFKEDVLWDCIGSGAVAGLASLDTKTSVIEWQTTGTNVNPFSTSVGPGFVNSTCQFPQITDQGLADSFLHGADLRSVYAPRLGLGNTFKPSEVYIRVTNNVITSQVSSGLLRGLFPQSIHIQVHVQPNTFDSLEPTYSCPKASKLRNDFTTGSKGQIWQDHLSAAEPIYEKLDRVSGIARQDTGGWHSSFDHYYDNMSAKQCHGKLLPCSINDTSLCISQEEADTVYRLGNWEYSYLYRDAPDSAAYSALRFGAWALELKSHLIEKMQGVSKLKYIHNIAHDGSISSLLGLLQIDIMVWPGMGSEVVFELYQNKNTKKYHIRVLFSGQPMKTSTPLGMLDMIKIEDFFAYLDLMVGNGEELVKSCNL